jgi:GT2 family glycosyltransferase
MPGSFEPRVSVVLPTFNRAAFLDEAFACIRAQTLADWELIVVDDGSTDETRPVVTEMASAETRPVRYTYQHNQGPAAARNAGIDVARGKYIAFFDSDDLWLPEHLAACVGALEANLDVDWAYGACRIVDLQSGAELSASSFHPRGERHPFLELTTRKAGDFNVITDDRATEGMIAHGLMCGLQCSVLRRRVFDVVRLPLQRIAEDQIFVVQALKAGFRLGYFDRVHRIYRVHDDSSSAPSSPGTIDKAVAGLHELVAAYEELPRHVHLTAREQKTLRRRLADEWFWTLGYSLLWQNGRRAEALDAFRHGLKLQPLDHRLWKTYAGAIARTKAAR